MESQLGGAAARRTLSSVRLWFVLSLAACRFGFDARPGDAASGDALALETCDPAAPFGTPVPIAELNDPTVDDGTLRLAPDELSGYFWSYRGGNSDIYLATRPDRASPFTVSTVSGLNTAKNEVDPTVSSDGTLLVFRHNGPSDQLWTATRAAPAQFANPAVDAQLTSGAGDVEPFWQVGGQELYFSSKRSGDGDLYRSTYSGTFSAPALVSELSVATSEEGDPVIAPDGLTIYFRSNRPSGGPMAFNIWTASRTVASGAFDVPTLVANVNSDADEGPSWLSLDGCRLYLSSDRAGTNDIYVATRGP